MNIGFKFAAAWIGATLVAVVIASAAVGSVRSQVTDDALPLGSPDVAALAVGVTNALDTTTTQAPASSSTSTALGSGTTSTSTTLPSGPSTTSTTSPASTTSTTTAPTTTAAPSPEYSRTFDTPGGSVRVVVKGNDVTFGGAVPKTGWSIELKDPGPQEVKVEFEQNGGEGDIEFTATIENGELKVEISGGDDDH